MRVNIEGDGPFLTIQINKVLTTETIRSWNAPVSKDVFSDEPKPPYIDDLFWVMGMKEIWLQHRHITMIRDENFSWHKMIGTVLIILWNHLAPQEELTFMFDGFSTPVTRDYLMGHQMKLATIRED